MARTQIRGQQILDGSVKRKDLNTDNPVNAVVRKVLAGDGMSMQYDGATEGTGDVTLSVSYTYGQLVGTNIISTTLDTDQAIGTPLILNVGVGSVVKLSTFIQWSCDSSNCEPQFFMYENGVIINDTRFTNIVVKTCESGAVSVFSLQYILTDPSVGENTYSIGWNRNRLGGTPSAQLISSKRIFIIETL